MNMILVKREFGRNSKNSASTFVPSLGMISLQMEVFVFIYTLAICCRVLNAVRLDPCLRESARKMVRVKCANTAAKTGPSAAAKIFSIKLALCEVQHGSWYVASLNFGGSPRSATWKRMLECINAVCANFVM